MPFPWEMALPAIMVVAFTYIGEIGVYGLQTWDNDWKPPRHTLDNWNVQMMERDRRLTGSKRGQRDDPIAPDAFATNSIWDMKSRQA